MPRRERQGTPSFGDITECEWALLVDEVPPNAEPGGRNAWEWFFLLNWRPFHTRLSDDERNPRDIWELLGASVLPDWIEANPGRRPSLWWRFVAPEIQCEPWMYPDRCGFYDHCPPLDVQLDFLRRHNLLLPSEACTLVLTEAIRA
jgi:hypothetical protein